MDYANYATAAALPRNVFLIQRRRKLKPLGVFGEESHSNDSPPTLDSPVRAWGDSTILKPKWVGIPMEDASAPYDPRMEARTKYRQAIPIDQAGDFMTVVEGETQELATVVKSG